MPSLPRKNGNMVSIPDNDYETIIKAIKTEPGLTTFDYEAKTLVPVQRINDILAVTAEGQRLVRAGKVAVDPNRKGLKPEFHSIKGAKLNPPTVKGAMTLRLGAIKPLDADMVVKNEGIRAEYGIEVELANEAMLRPSQSPKLRAARRDRMIEIANAQATREDGKTTAISNLRQDIDTLKDYNQVLKETIDLLRQLPPKKPEPTE